MKAWLWERAARTPEALALEARGLRISYGELNARAERRAAALRAWGCAPGDRVGALFGNDPAFVEWLHAAACGRVVLVQRAVGDCVDAVMFVSARPERRADFERFLGTMQYEAR